MKLINLSNSISPLSLPASGRPLHGRQHVIKRWPSKKIASLPVLEGTLKLFSAVALSISCYLAWVAFSSGNIAGCGSGNVFDCSPILHSRWSTIFGVPVSLPAAVLYATALAFISVPGSFRGASKWRWAFISFLSFLAGLAGLWFVGLQAFWLQHFCPYCLAVHMCGLVMMGMIAWKAPTGKIATRRLAVGAFLCVAAFIVSQMAIDAPASYEMIEHDSINIEAGPDWEKPPSPITPMEENIFESPALDSNPPDQAVLPLQLQMEIAAFIHPTVWLSCQTIGSTASKTPQQAAPAKDGRRTTKILNSVWLDVAQWPVLGNPDAKFVIVEMLDYTCQHCQVTNGAIRGAKEKYGDQLAVIVLPVPMNLTCNPFIKATAAHHKESCELAKLAIAVWRLEPKQFSACHHWLFESKRTYAGALQHAQQIVDEKKLKGELESNLPTQYIDKIVKLYHRAGAGAIPKLLFPNSTAVGEMRSTSALISMIDRELDPK